MAFFRLLFVGDGGILGTWKCYLSPSFWFLSLFTSSKKSFDKSPNLCYSTTMIRHIPESKNPGLRFQVGRIERRPEQIAVYNGERVVRYDPGPDEVEVFHFLHGAQTLVEAEAYAKALKEP
jgi:hypothetical protein